MKLEIVKKFSISFKSIRYFLYVNDILDQSYATLEESMTALNIIKNGIASGEELVFSTEEV